MIRINRFAANRAIRTAVQLDLIWTEARGLIREASGQPLSSDPPLSVILCVQRDDPNGEAETFETLIAKCFERGWDDLKRYCQVPATSDPDMGILKNDNRAL